MTRKHKRKVLTMKKRKKREYYKTEQEFMESVTKTPQTQLTTVCLAVRYNLRGNKDGR